MRGSCGQPSAQASAPSRRFAARHRALPRAARFCQKQAGPGRTASSSRRIHDTHPPLAPRHARRRRPRLVRRLVRRLVVHRAHLRRADGPPARGWHRHQLRRAIGQWIPVHAGLLLRSRPGRGGRGRSGRGGTGHRHLAVAPADHSRGARRPRAAGLATPRRRARGGRRVGVRLGRHARRGRRLRGIAKGAGTHDVRDRTGRDA